MKIEIHVEGDVVERTELLNGTVTIAIEGASADGVWVVSGVVSWNRGLVDYAGEGDVSFSRGEDELFASLTSATVDHGEAEDGDAHLHVRYEIDGGTGDYARAAGVVEAAVRLEEDRFEGRWVVRVQQ